MPEIVIIQKYSFYIYSMADYRSDTLTQPTQAMMNAMYQAKVGDDVFGEDPSVNALEHYASDLFGLEAALFCPSGAMTNQIAIKCHTRPGDEVICDRLSHVYMYEGGGVAFNSGCQVRTLAGERGKITGEMVSENINPKDVHRPVSRLVVVEDTVNRGGGAIYDFEEIVKIKEVCHQHDLKLHLDGARLFNALAETKEDPKIYGKVFDSISICLSKGLGAPVGSLLIGDAAFTAAARRVRKVLGGGMRQAGFLAAAGSYALKNHVERLKDDHHHAKKIAEALLKKPFIGKMMPVDTNIIIFEVLPPYTAQSLTEKLNEYGIRVLTVSASQIRMVLHLDITPAMVAETIKVIDEGIVS